MSYAEAELGFQGIHTACLTGNNGNGKSALLDAMTWAIWGQARGVEKHGAGVDDLVRLGCEEMAVEFQFELDEQVFRVIRKRDKRRQASALELQVYTGESFRSLTGDKLGDTQAKINQVLKMDYETFTNSAFILQGKADTFTTQKASERKRILGEILGLAYYERLERRARDKMNQSEAEVKELDRLIRQMEEELAGENAARMAWETAKLEKLAVDASLLGKEKRFEELTAAMTELQGLAKKKQELLDRITAGERQTGVISGQVENLAKRINGLKEILAREQEIAAGYQKLQEVQAAEDAANAKQTRALELMQRLNRLESELAGESSKLQGELAGLKSQIAQAEKAQARGEDARERCLALEKELQTLQAQEKEKTALQGVVIKLQGEISEKDGQLRSLDKELKDLRERFKTLHLAEAKCPLCSNSLSPSQKDSLLSQMTAEGTEKKNVQARLTDEIDKLKDQILLTEKKLNSIALERTAQVQSGLELARRDIEEGNKARETLERLRTAEAEHNLALKTNSFAPEVQAELKLVQEEQLNLAYDKDYHFSLRAELQQLRVFAEQYSNLAEIKANLPGDEELMQQLVQQREREQAECQNHRETIALLEGQLVRLAEVEREYPDTKAEVIRLRQEKSKLESQLGALEEKLNHLAKLKKQRKENLALREAAARIKQLFNQLVTAFGKRGIQAMIIENSIPELQDEANNLLARMSDGRMHLTLLTQRDNKKGGVTETLDIRIADELGTRKYEMFSGGEAFRVNFALRIALSKLLARRAGAKLQTLVIDEGFGTQDGAGRERLIEVINTIKDDFAKIIIITHIQELKDAFPVQIEVEKTAEGSCLKFM